MRIGAFVVLPDRFRGEVLASTVPNELDGGVVASIAAVETVERFTSVCGRRTVLDVVR